MVKGEMVVLSSLRDLAADPILRGPDSRSLPWRRKTSTLPASADA